MRVWCWMFHPNSCLSEPKLLWGEKKEEKIFIKYCINATPQFGLSPKWKVGVQINKGGNSFWSPAWPFKKDVSLACYVKTPAEHCPSQPLPVFKHGAASAKAEIIHGQIDWRNRHENVPRMWYDSQDETTRSDELNTEGNSISTQPCKIKENKAEKCDGCILKAGSVTLSQRWDNNKAVI